MNFQQLRIIRETVRCNYNLTEVANALFTSQPGVSKHIKDLEDELGVKLFVRKGKRLTGITDPGRELLAIVERMLQDAANIKQIAQQFVSSNHGELTVATTHTQATYVLPAVVMQFKQAFPNVHLCLLQGGSGEIENMLLNGTADIGLMPAQTETPSDLVCFPCAQWRYGVLLPKDHELSKKKKLAIDDLAALPIITYPQGQMGRSTMDIAFARAQVTPNIVLSAQDADVIKTYVELGLGIGIMESIAFNPLRDKALTLMETDLFVANTSRVAVRRGHFLRGYAYRFIQLCAPDLDEATVKAKVVLHPDLEEASSFSASL